MNTFKRTLPFLAIFVTIFILSSCGSATSTTTTGASQSAPTTASSNGYGSTANTPTVSAAIKTATATVDGKAETILTDAKGMTLYYFTADTAAKTACTGPCVQNWPALLASDPKSVNSDPKLPGELGVYPNANGNQVIYNNHPLYTFAGDSSAGQLNGQGKAGKWFVATPTLALNK